jgi:hypothetical protein
LCFCLLFLLTVEKLRRSWGMIFRPDFIEFSLSACVSVTPLGAWMAPSTFSSGLVGSKGAPLEEVSPDGVDLRDSLFLWTVEDMVECWPVLTIEEVFCGSIFLYNRGYRKESLFWYYSAWARLEYFSLGVGEYRSHSSEVFDRCGAFLTGLRPWLLAYGYFHPDVFTFFVEGVRKDLEGIFWPNIYPLVSLSGDGAKLDFLDRVATFFSCLRPPSCWDSYLPGLDVRDVRFESLSSKMLCKGWIKD